MSTLPFFPGQSWQITYEFPKVPEPSPPATLSEHLKRCRQKTGLTQAEAAQKMGISEWTMIKWEMGEKEPLDRLWPTVIGFLGYDPSPEPTSCGEGLRVARRRVGLSAKALAKEIGCDPETVAKWERGEQMPKFPHLHVLQKLSQR